MEAKNQLILINFLKSGYSTRQLDKLIGDKNTRGWTSWQILKKYKLTESDKGKLYLYGNQQATKIIKELEHKNITQALKNNTPSLLKKYEETYVLSKSEKSFYDIMSGETRNIILGFFSNQKKLINKCQLEGCKTTKTLDTVHFNKDRPQIFKECAKNNKVEFEDYFKYDVYKTMACFLRSHAKFKSVCFLCKKHHLELHKKEKGSKAEFIKFKNRVIF